MNKIFGNCGQDLISAEAGLYLKWNFDPLLEQTLINLSEGDANKVLNKNIEDILAGRIFFYSGKLDAYGILFSRGAKINNFADSQSGATTLHLLSKVRNPSENTQIDSVKPIFMALNSEISAQDRAGFTPLHYAATHCDNRRLLLIELGADKHFKALNGLTPTDLWAECKP